MISPQNRALLETLPSSAHGRALQEYLEEEIQSIGDISSCQSWDETLGRKHAIKLLKGILFFYEEKKSKPKSPSQYT